MRTASWLPVVLAIALLGGCADEPPPRGRAETERLPEGIVVMPGALGGARHARMAGQRPMSAGELQSCAGNILTLDAQGKSLEAAASELSRVRRGVEAEGLELDLLRTKVNTRDGKQVDAFNARLEAHREAIRSHNRRAEAQNRDADVYRVTLNEFRTRCVGRGYLQSDLDRLTPQEKDAIGRASSVSDIPATIVNGAQEF